MLRELIEEGKSYTINPQINFIKQPFLVDATYRSHILRLNDVQLSDIIMFSTFFESKYLQDEWINGMFTSDPRTKP